MRYLVINTKNYLEASGKKLSDMCSFIQQKSRHSRVKIMLAVPAFEIGIMKKMFPRLLLFAQHLDNMNVGSTTGYLVPEIAQKAGARGSLINHSEHTVDQTTIALIVKKLNALKMTSIVCAKDEKEVANLTVLGPDFIAIEPPELIGSGRAVSKYSPQIISKSREALEKVGTRKTKLLCGAGIVNGEDARISVELGAEGVLVASGVVKSKNWRSAINDLLNGLSDE